MPFFALLTLLLVPKRDEEKLKGLSRRCWELYAPEDLGALLQDMSLLALLLSFQLAGGARISHRENADQRTTKDCSYLLPDQILHGANFLKTGQW